MSRVSPTIEGFRTAFRRPTLSLAEITWRWAVGATACALLLFWLFEYLNTLPVTNGDLLFLRTRHPVLVGQAVTHILRGSLNRAVMAGLIGTLALTYLWDVAASLGRAATVRTLLQYFRKDVVVRPPSSQTFRCLFRLNFLRAALALAALVALPGAAILTSFASPPANPRPGLVFFLFLPLAALIFLAWWALNWFLSLAAIFVVRDGADALDALSAAVTFCRERTGPLFAVSAWMGLAHLIAFSGASTALSVPLSLTPIAPARLVLFGILLLTLVYFAVVDWLYVARLAGYVCITEMPEAMFAPAPPAPPLRPAPSVPVQTSVDRNEPILSDVPGLVAET
jgi:hypothetical protein